MDVVDWLRSLRRRWLVSIVMMLITAGAVFGVSELVLTRYEASASLLLLGPNSYVDPEGDDVKVNPYARFGGAGEGITGTTLIAVLMSPQALRQAEIDGFPGAYVMSFDPSGGGAIIDITVTSESARGSLDGLEQIVATAQETLIQQQTDAGAPEASLVKASRLTRSEQADSLNGAKIRAMGVTAVLGLALTLLVARGLDLRLQHTRSQSRPKPVQAAAEMEAGNVTGRGAPLLAPPGIRDTGTGPRPARTRAPAPERQDGNQSAPSGGSAFSAHRDRSDDSDLARSAEEDSRDREQVSYLESMIAPYGASVGTRSTTTGT